jgi:hypothetical protein
MLQGARYADTLLRALPLRTRAATNALPCARARAHANRCVCAPGGRRLWAALSWRGPRRLRRIDRYGSVTTHDGWAITASQTPGAVGFHMLWATCLCAGRCKSTGTASQEACQRRLNREGLAVMSQDRSAMTGSLTLPDSSPGPACRSLVQPLLVKRSFDAFL